MKKKIKEKAKEIANKRLQWDCTSLLHTAQECESSALEMAEWMQEQKDREREILEGYAQKTEKILTEKCDDIASLIRENQKLQEEKEQMIEEMRKYVHKNWVGGDTYVFDLSELIKIMWGK